MLTIHCDQRNGSLFLFQVYNALALILILEPWRQLRENTCKEIIEKNNESHGMHEYSFLSFLFLLLIGISTILFSLGLFMQAECYSTIYNVK